MGAGERETNSSLGDHPGVRAKSGGEVGGRGEVEANPFSDDDLERTRNGTAQQTQHKSVEPGLTGGLFPHRRSLRRLEDVKLHQTNTNWTKLPELFQSTDLRYVTLMLFVCLVGFSTSSSTTRLYRGRAPRLTSANFTCCHTRDRAGRP